MARGPAATGDRAHASFTELRSDLGWLLSEALRGYVTAATGAVADIPGGLRGYHLLAAVAVDACSSQLKLAEGLRVDRTVMTHLIDGLEAQRLVERRPDPADRRARRVLITEKGRRVLDTCGARLRKVRAELLAPLADEEQRLLVDVLARVGARVEPGTADLSELCQGQGGDPAC
ncbi:MAG TPA: MarR family transcriptional regulator [Candidatus Dormibacteraeota bacterium]|jgi:DNA-binding MarR family transcriptional regulator|nr:MarR family transcriptional regulator [Candidatus Dormibacteraeota bacterium]